MSQKGEKFLKHMLGNTVEEAEETFKEFSKVLNDLARSYSMKSGLERADLFGEGIVGLARAKRDFDPERSKNFKTFAIYKIKDAMHNHIRSSSRPTSIPAYIWRLNRWISEARVLLEGAGMTPSMADSVLCGQSMFAENVGERCEELLRFINDEAERQGVNQEKLVRRAESLPSKEGVEETSDNSGIQELEDKIAVEDLRKRMNKTESLIADGIMEGKTHKEIAESLGYTTPWVTQQLKKMRKKLEKVGGENE